MDFGNVRGDLAQALDYVPTYLYFKYIGSIRQITNYVGDADTFKPIWDRWRQEDIAEKGTSELPTFEKMMDPNFDPECKESY